MAFPASALAVVTFVDVLDTTQLALDLDLETHKVALVTNASTPDFSSAATVAKYGNAQFTEHAATGGYTAGGSLLTSTTVTESPASVLMWDGADVSWAASTLTGVRGCLIYADAIAAPNADPAILLVNFGADYATNNGTFTIQWAATGIGTIDLY